MKSVLISIQPYWVFLIIAKTMGWNIDKEKTVEVRKTFPKGENWDKVAKIYCSKDKKSFAQIPKEYQPLMERFLGKVIGEFVCDKSTHGFWITPFADYLVRNSCLSYREVFDYSNGKPICAWHISNLVIYDKPRELSEFIKPCENDLYCEVCAMYSEFKEKCYNEALQIKRPPQSWCYVESEVEGE